MTLSPSDQRAAEHVKQIIDAAVDLTDALITDLDKRVGGLHADHRAALRPEWIPLVARYLVAPRTITRSIPGDVRFTRPVVCAWCDNRHRATVPFETTTQGDGCAASVFQITAANAQAIARMLTRDRTTTEKLPDAIGEWLVKGHYGSTYDCQLFRFVQNTPTADASPVCDNCVGERHLAGDLEQIAGNYP